MSSNMKGEIYRWMMDLPQDEEGCIIFPFLNIRNGYGRVSYNARTYSAHRFSYMTYVGEIPDGMVIDHMCHMRLCVNPRHLRAVPQSANAQNRAKLSSNNKSGWPNVSRDGKWWRATVMKDGIKYDLGRFGCPTKAGLAALAKRKELRVLRC